MAKYISDRQRNLKIGITSYTENLTVLEVTGGAYISSYVGIGTTNPTQSLHIQGSARLTGALYDSTNVAGNSGQVLQTTGSGIIWSNASDVGILTYVDRSGIATFATNAGIATFATNAGIATYADRAGIATFATNAGISTFATNAGVSTSVIGGIGSITGLYVSGISTLGTVLISSGIVTATIGIVTYYGDGSKLTGIQTSGVVSVINQDPNTPIVYPTLVNSVGVSSLGISTTKLSFIPSSGKLGLGTVTPRENLDVIGTIGIQSAGTSNRFYLQHNSSENSLDFIFV